MTPVEYLKDKFNDIASRRSSGELEMWEAYQLREKAFEEAVQMEKDLCRLFCTGGVMIGRDSIELGYRIHFEKSFNQLYKKYTI
jgi:hypothetical protein